jgi:hypothetical protein
VPSWQVSLDYPACGLQRRGIIMPCWQVSFDDRAWGRLQRRNASLDYRACGRLQRRTNHVVYIYRIYRSVAEA